jgi:probable rRNA maturation factor
LDFPFFSLSWGPVPVAIANLQRRLRLPRRRIERLVGRILRAEGRPRARVSLAVVGNGAIRRLNRRHLGHDTATDVLAFPLGEPGCFGEVVVSADVAAAEARRRGIPPEEELLRYVAHGLLHLLGYRDQAPAQRRRMWERQERYLRA